MKIHKTLFISAIITILLITTISVQAQSTALSVKLRGKILLKVQDKGQAYYLNPIDDKAYYLGRPADALNIMSKLGLGVSEKDYNAFVKNNNTAPQRLAGRILLRVQNKGEAYYVHPTTYKMFFLINPIHALNIMSSLGLGISSSDLEKLEIVNVVIINNTNNKNTKPKHVNYLNYDYYPYNLYPNTHPDRSPDLHDECSEVGKKTCRIDTAEILTCGNHDQDEYLDWGNPASPCPKNTTCRNGDFKCVPVQDCNQKDFKMAFVLLEDSAHPHTPKNIEILNELKKRTAERFSWATRGLGNMDTSYPVSIVRIDDINDDSKYRFKDSPVVKEFYKTNPDIFDFITIFTTSPFPDYQFTTSNSKNHTKGIGDGIGDAGYDLGSQNSKLLGHSWIDDINRYEYQDDQGTHPIERDYIGGVNGILYETTHQWVGYIKYLDTDGQQKSLMSELNGGGWNLKLDSGIGRMAVMGGYPWIDNGDGTFTAKRDITIDDAKEAYSDLELYLMGLLSKEQVKPLKFIESSYSEKDEWINNSTITGKIKYITIDQIIAVIGKRECIF